MGSATELEYHLLLARDLGFIGDADYEGLRGAVTEIKRMLASFLQTLRLGRRVRRAER
jgi:four helix bundle protein